MRPTLLLATTLLLSLKLVGTVMGQNLGLTTFSVRLGDEVDSTERRYVALFPTIVAFERAYINKNSERGPIVTVQRSVGGDTTLTITLESAEELAKYADQLEDVYRGVVSVDWSKLRGLVAPRSPFSEGEVYTITDRDSTEHRGRLLWADASRVVLWPIDSLYRWQRAGDMALVLAPGDILSIHSGEGRSLGRIAGAGVGMAAGYLLNQSIDRDQGLLRFALPLGAFAGTLALGDLLGGAADRSWTNTSGGSIDQFLAAQRSRAIFFDVPPPEVLAMQPSHAAATRLVVSHPPPSPVSSIRLRVASGGSRITSQDYTVNTLGRNSTYYLSQDKGILSATAEYRLTPHFALGLGYTRLPRLTDSAEAVAVRASSIEISGSYSLETPSAVSSRFSVFLSAAIGLCSFHTDTRLPEEFSGSVVATSASTDGGGFSGHAQGGLRYHLFPVLFLDISYSVYQTFGTTIPALVQTSSVGPVARIDEQDLSLTSSAFLLGLGVEF